MKAQLVLLALVAALLPATALAGSPNGDHEILYTYAGQLAAAPGPGSLTLDVMNGNHAALHSLVGQSSRQTFGYDATTEFLRWTNGVPTVVAASALVAGDWVRVNVRAHRGSALSEIESTAPGVVGDHGPMPGHPTKPLFLFRGTLTAVGASGATVDVRGGNRHALRLLIGQASQQTFAFDAGTVILLWQGKAPSQISAGQLKAGDRIVVRVRADWGSSLAQVEATPAGYLAEHEPPPAT